MLFLGIDPGNSGGFAIIDNNFKLINISAFNLISFKNSDHGKTITELNSSWLYEILRLYPVNYAAIEIVNSRKGQGVVSTFTFGKNYGELLSILKIIKTPYCRVESKAWQEEILGKHTDDKQVAIDYIKNKYLDVNLKRTSRCTTDHHGISDAICLAEYGLKKFKKLNG